MRLWVIDASVVLAFYLPAEPYKTQALALLEDYAAGAVKLVAPTLVYYEVLNALSRAVRGLKTGRRIDREEALVILAALGRLKLEEWSAEGLERRILEITEGYQRSGYDAAYLALAEHLEADLLTGDERFYNAVKGDFSRVQFISSLCLGSLLPSIEVYSSMISSSGWYSRIHPRWITHSFPSITAWPPAESRNSVRVPSRHHRQYRHKCPLPPGPGTLPGLPRWSCR